MKNLAYDMLEAKGVKFNHHDAVTVHDLLETHAKTIFSHLGCNPEYETSSDLAAIYESFRRDAHYILLKTEGINDVADDNDREIIVDEIMRNTNRRMTFGHDYKSNMWLGLWIVDLQYACREEIVSFLRGEEVRQATKNMDVIFSGTYSTDVYLAYLDAVYGMKQSAVSPFEGSFNVAKAQKVVTEDSNNKYKMLYNNKEWLLFKKRD